MSTELTGVINIMATPFDPEGQIDEASLRRLVDFQIEKGAAGLNVLGIMGEFHKLLDDERRRVAEIVIDQAGGRVPVIVGCTHSGTYAAIQLALHAQEAGAAAVMVAPPNNLKNLDAVYEHYRAVASALRIPVVVQDEPTFTGVAMPPAFLARVCNDIPGCDYIKLEESPTPEKISRLTGLLQRPVGIFGGLGGVFFLEELNRGAIGTMTGFSYTEILVDIEQKFKRGDRAAARETFYRYLPLLRFEFQPVVGLALRKYTLYRRGAIAHPHVRQPGPSVSNALTKELDHLLAHCGLS